MALKSARLVRWVMDDPAGTAWNYRRSPAPRGCLFPGSGGWTDAERAGVFREPTNKGKPRPNPG